jgi:predicted RNA-binding Zn-ribbon protein involved in translation (DUF1610 family)
MKRDETQPNLARLTRTLDQELAALVRGVSLECLVCGEFLIHRGRARACPECGSVVRDDGDSAAAGLQSDAQAG